MGQRGGAPWGKLQSGNHRERCLSVPVITLPCAPFFSTPDLWEWCSSSGGFHECLARETPNQARPRDAIALTPISHAGRAGLIESERISLTGCKILHVGFRKSVGVARKLCNVRHDGLLPAAHASFVYARTRTQATQPMTHPDCQRARSEGNSRSSLTQT